MTDEDERTLAALLLLPPRLRTVLVMCEIKRVPMEEAARQLGLSRRTVERRWARAVEMMVERLEVER